MLLWVQNYGLKFYRADTVQRSNVYFFRGTLRKRLFKRKKTTKQALFFCYILFAGFLWCLLDSCTESTIACGSLNLFTENVFHKPDIFIYEGPHSLAAHTGHYHWGVFLNVLTAPQRSKQHPVQVLNTGIQYIPREDLRSFMLAGWILLKVGTFAIAFNLVMGIKKWPMWIHHSSWKHSIPSTEFTSFLLWKQKARLEERNPLPPPMIRTCFLSLQIVFNETHSWEQKKESCQQTACAFCGLFTALIFIGVLYDMKN